MCHISIGDFGLSGEHIGIFGIPHGGRLKELDQHEADGTKVEGGIRCSTLLRGLQSLIVASTNQPNFSPAALKTCSNFFGTSYFPTTTSISFKPFGSVKR